MNYKNSPRSPHEAADHLAMRKLNTRLAIREESPLLACRSYSLLVWSLENRGCNMDEVLERAKIQREQLSQAYARISVKQAQLLVNEAYRLTGDPALGLNFGQRISMIEYGPVSVALMGCSSLLAVIKLVQKYYDLLHHAGSLSVSDDGDCLELRWDFPHNDRLLRRFCVETWMVGWQNYAKAFAREQQLIDIEFIFDFPRPTYFSAYTKVFCSKLTFDGTVPAVRLPKEILNRSIPLALDSQICKLARKQCDKLLRSVNQYNQLLDKIYVQLTQDTVDTLSVETTAAQLGTTPRTLIRNLNEIGTLL